MEELYAYDPRNRLISYTKGGVTVPYQYDYAGNLLADDKALYSYDSFNRTERVETFDGNVQVNRYEYDAWGKVTAQGETVPNRFTYNGQQFDPITQ